MEVNAGCNVGGMRGNICKSRADTEEGGWRGGEGRGGGEGKLEGEENLKAEFQAKPDEVAYNYQMWIFLSGK